MTPKEDAHCDECVVKVTILTLLWNIHYNFAFRFELQRFRTFSHRLCLNISAHCASSSGNLSLCPSFEKTSNLKCFKVQKSEIALKWQLCLIFNSIQYSVDTAFNIVPHKTMSVNDFFLFVFKGDGHMQSAADVFLYLLALEMNRYSWSHIYSCQNKRFMRRNFCWLSNTIGAAINSCISEAPQPYEWETIPMARNSSSIRSLSPAYRYLLSPVTDTERIEVISCSFKWSSTCEKMCTVVRRSEKLTMYSTYSSMYERLTFGKENNFKKSIIKYLIIYFDYGCVHFKMCSVFIKFRSLT